MSSSPSLSTKSTPPPPLVRHEVDEETGIHRIILDRPQARNAISRQLLSQLEAALDDVHRACAAPSPAWASIAWKREQEQKRRQRQRLRQAHEDAAHGFVSERNNNDDADDAGLHIATLNWPTPPPSRRGSAVPLTGLSDARISSSSSSLPSPSPPSSRSASVQEGAVASHSPARCLILQSSSTKAFCAGADLAERKHMSPDEVLAFLARLRRVMTKLDDMPIPTVAAIDGPALGGGLELALACDFRTASAIVKSTDGAEKTTSSSSPLRPIMGFPECQLAIMPGAGGTQRATRLLGVSRAKALILTGQLLDAQHAFDWGLVTHLAGHEGQDTSTAIEAADALAKQMQRSAPLALAAAKAAIDVGSELPDLEGGLDWEAACYRALLPTQDRREALHAFAEKRQPHFVGQ